MHLLAALTKTFLLKKHLYFYHKMSSNRIGVQRTYIIPSSLTENLSSGCFPFRSQHF